MVESFGHVLTAVSHEAVFGQAFAFSQAAAIGHVPSAFLASQQALSQSFGHAGALTLHEACFAHALVSEQASFSLAENRIGVANKAVINTVKAMIIVFLINTLLTKEFFGDGTYSPISEAISILYQNNRYSVRVKSNFGNKIVLSCNFRNPCRELGLKLL